MILNGYAVLDAFVMSVRLPLGLVVAGLACAAWWRSRRPISPDSRSAWEDRCYLVILTAVVGLVLNLAAWPLFYALLQSYVPQWPGVMCIYGVMQIGSGSSGSSRFLPHLLAALQAFKPALIFISGTWFVLYLAHRRSPRLVLMRRVLLLLAVFGLATTADAAVEGAYLAIPKKEQFLDAGCCTPVLDQAARSGRSGLAFPNLALSWLPAAYYTINTALVITLVGYFVSPGRLSTGAVLLVTFVGTIVAVPVNGAFLVEIAAPKILGLPYHHCPYDLLPRAPEGLLGIATFLMGSFAVGWAGVVQTWGRIEGAPREECSLVDRLLFLAAFGFTASLVFFIAALAVAG